MMNTRQMDAPCLGLCLPPKRLLSYFEVFVILHWKTGDEGLSNSSLKTWSCCVFRGDTLRLWKGQVSCLSFMKQRKCHFIYLYIIIVNTISNASPWTHVSLPFEELHSPNIPPTLLVVHIWSELYCYRP